MIGEATTGSRRRLGRAVAALALVSTLVVTVVSTSAGASPTATSLDPATAASALHTDGRFARDGQGRVVVLHGLFGVWKTSTWDPTDSDTDPAGFTSTDARHVADLGFDLFRLAYFWEGLEPDARPVSAKYLDDIARVGAPAGHPQRAHRSSTRTRTCTARCSTATGSRPGRSTTTALTLVTDTGFPLNYFTPAVERTFTNFWANDQGCLDAYDQQLAVVARRFARRSDGPGLRPHQRALQRREPVDLRQRRPVARTGMPRAQPGRGGHGAGACARPRANQLVFYEPQIFANWGTPNGVTADPATGPEWRLVPRPVHGPGLLPDHPRSGRRPGHGGRRSVPGQNAAVMANALAASGRDWRVAAHDRGGRGHRRRLRRPRVHPRAGRSQHDRLDLRAELAQRRAAPSRPDQAGRAVTGLSPAIAGNPTSYGFDPRTGDFALSYATAADITGRTVIYLPLAQQYPNGYTVSVSGAHVVSAPGASRLRAGEREGHPPGHRHRHPRGRPGDRQPPNLAACPG